MRIDFECSAEDLEWAGLSCSGEEACPVYLELSAVEPVSDKIFVTGNIHTAAATLASILLASEDAGKTWHEPHVRIRAAGLEQIQFVDFETGWIGGQILQPVTRDPFLLLTTDGGKTWRDRPIFDESRAGAIERFRFDSRTHGTVWIDRTRAGERGARHELYESVNGGESWMLREASDRPIRGKPEPARPPDSGWRLRADGETKSYRTEKLRGDQWETIASFLIRIGECKSRSLEPPP